MSVAMIAITTRSSTSVNPGDRRFFSFHMRVFRHGGGLEQALAKITSEFTQAG